MKTADEFEGGFPDWRLAVCPDQPTLFTEVIQCLQGGMPAILCVRKGDHWVVIVGVEIDDGTSEVTRMIVLDPLPQNLGNVTHTYVDGCEQEGLTYVEHVEDPKTQVELAGLQLALKNTPSPPTLNHYAGKCVAVVYGPSWNRALAKLRQIRVLPVPPYVWRPKAPLSGTVPNADIESMRQALQRARSALGDHVVTRSPDGTTRARRSNRVRRRWATAPCTISCRSLLRRPGTGSSGRFGLKTTSPCTFDSQESGSSLESLKAHPDQPLWWTLNWLPELQSPYFPFARQLVGNKFVYQSFV